MTIADYNPIEIKKIPVIGIPVIRIGQLPFINVFGETDRAYIIEETDEPYLLWESGVPMQWENKESIKLEEQKKRIWLQRVRR